VPWGVCGSGPCAVGRGPGCALCTVGPVPYVSWRCAPWGLCHMYRGVVHRGACAMYRGPCAWPCAVYCGPCRATLCRVPLGLNASGLVCLEACTPGQNVHRMSAVRACPCAAQAQLYSVPMLVLAHKLTSAAYLCFFGQAPTQCARRCFKGT